MPKNKHHCSEYLVRSLSLRRRYWTERSHRHHTWAALKDRHSQGLPWAKGKPTQPQQHKVLSPPERIRPQPDLVVRPQLWNRERVVMPIPSLLITHIHLLALPIFPEESRLFSRLVWSYPGKVCTTQQDTFLVWTRFCFLSLLLHAGENRFALSFLGGGDNKQWQFSAPCPSWDTAHSKLRGKSRSCNQVPKFMLRISHVMSTKILETALCVCVLRPSALPRSLCAR